MSFASQSAKGRTRPAPAASARGRVVFVGTGPGDPDLLTLAAVGALGDADTVLLDRDALREMFEHPQVRIPGNARIESVAELVTPEDRAGHVAMIVEAGRRVVRLVEGDPFLDGRVALEAAACVSHGIDFEVIPGVSSLTAVPEYAGIALDDSRGVQFLTLAPGETCQAERAAHWATVGTLVASMRVGQVPQFVEATVAGGRPSDDPVVLTCHGGSTDQISVRAVLGKLEEAVAARGLDDDTQVHLMVGLVHSPTGSLDWYETKPLFGWRILLPKTKEPSAQMRERLHSYGARSEEVPTIAVEPPRSPQQMERAVRGLVEGRFEWVVFTSVNAVKAVREKFESYGLDARAFSGLRVAAASQVTADSLQQWGIDPDLVPDGDQTAVALAEEFPPYDESMDPINRVFLPRADIATETLAAALTDLGWEVEDITAYRTVRASPPPAPTREAIKTGKFDAVVFTSSSTVRNLVGIAGKPHHTTVIAAIGPATAKTCEEHGLRVDVLAGDPDPVAVVDSLAHFAAERRQGFLDRGEDVRKPSARKPRGRRRT